MSSKRGHSRELGFELTNVPNDQRPAAKFVCTICGEGALVMLKSGQALNPMLTAQSLCRKGWQAEPYNRQACRCPKCIEAKKHVRNDVDSELRKFVEVANMNKPAQVPAPAPIAIRDPTPEQRGVIRALLDKHFDGDDGCYLGDWSDQKIAEQAGTPRIIVERAREAAYGPIRVTAAQIELRKELANMRQDLVTLLGNVTAANDLVVGFKAEIDKLQKRLAAIEQPLRRAS